MKIEEVLSTAARMITAQALHEAKIDEITNHLRESPDDQSLIEQLTREAERAERMDEVIGKAFESWSSHPTLRHYMQCWSLIVEGKPDMDVPAEMTAEFRDATIKKVIDTPADFAAEVGGLMSQVRQLFLDNGIEPSRTGISTTTWVYDTPMSDIDFDIMNIALRTKFAKAIDSGLLRIRRGFNGWRFNAFPRVDDALKWVKEHPSN